MSIFQMMRNAAESFVVADKHNTFRYGNCSLTCIYVASFLSGIPGMSFWGGVSLTKS